MEARMDENLKKLGQLFSSFNAIIKHYYDECFLTKVV